jgi:hypothetical protein
MISRVELLVTVIGIAGSVSEKGAVVKFPAVSSGYYSANSMRSSNERSTPHAERTKSENGLQKVHQKTPQKENEREKNLFDTKNIQNNQRSKNRTM